MPSITAGAMLRPAFVGLTYNWSSQTKATGLPAEYRQYSPNIFLAVTLAKPESWSSRKSIVVWDVAMLMTHVQVRDQAEGIVRTGFFNLRRSFRFDVMCYHFMNGGGLNGCFANHSRAPFMRNR